MTQSFHDESSLADAAIALGEQAMQQGIIPSFIVRHYPDSRQFLIPDGSAEPITPEQAYLKFKQMLGQV